MCRMIMWGVVVTGMLLIVACGTGLSRPSDVESRVPYPTPLTQGAHEKVPAAMWGVVDDPLIWTDAYSLAVHGIYLTDQGTSLLYSLSGYTAQELVDRKTVRIINEEGRASDLGEMWPLANLGGLEVGVMQLACRPFFSEELYLTVGTTSDNAETQKVIVARRSRPSQVDRIGGSSYGSWRQGELEQAGYRIEFAWDYKRATAKPPITRRPPRTPEGGTVTPIREATSLPRGEVVRIVPLIELPEGVDVVEIPSLKIEDILQRESHHLMVQLFSNGDVVGCLDDTLKRPRPVLVVPAATPISPYP